MNLSPYPNLRKAEKIRSTLRILQKYFLFSLFDSSVMLQIAAERACTLRSLIDRRCGIVGGPGWGWLKKKIAKTNSRGWLE